MRVKLRERLESEGLEILYKELLEIDPETSVNRNDSTRILRSLEVAYDGKFTMSSSERQPRDPGLSAVIFVLLPLVESCYQNINNRCELMLERGLLEETERLVNTYGEKLPALKSIGYRHCCCYLEGEISTKDELLEEMQKDTRRFAKRQRTWWRNRPEKLGWECRDIAIDASSSSSEITTILQAHTERNTTIVYRVSF